jgi:colanic acid/amylovoran biosynthesis protein
VRGTAMRIVLMGASLETWNRGVSALAASVCSMLEEYCAPCDITLLVPSRNAPEVRHIRGNRGTFDVRVICYSRGFGAGLSRSSIWALVSALVVRLLPLRAIRSIVRRRVVLIGAIEDADVVTDIFAGDSFSDIYGLRRLFFQALPRWCCLLLRKPYVLLPQTYGPYTNTLARCIGRSLVQRASMIYMRTHDDAALMSLAPRSSLKATYCPDVAFSLVPTSDYASSQFQQTDTRRSDDMLIVGLNVNGLLYNGGYNRQNMFGLQLDYPRFVDGILQALLSNSHLRVVMVPHTYCTYRLDDLENDLGAISKAAKRIHSASPRLSIIDQELDQHEIKGVIGACDVFIGSRLHSCIAALSQGVMTVGVGYSKKFLETFSTLGVAELVVDGRSTDADEAVQRITRLIADRESYVSIIKQGAERNTQAIHQTFARIGQMARTNAGR